LCGEARRLLDGRRKRYDFTMEAVDVDNDADLAARYGGSVPVVFVNGKQRFCGRVAPALLDRLLKVEAG
jgi:glutaredoxin